MRFKPEGYSGHLVEWRRWCGVACVGVKWLLSKELAAIVRGGSTERIRAILSSTLHWGAFVEYNKRRSVYHAEGGV